MCRALSGLGAEKNMQPSRGVGLKICRKARTAAPPWPFQTRSPNQGGRIPAVGESAACERRRSDYRCCRHFRGQQAGSRDRRAANGCAARARASLAVVETNGSPTQTGAKPSEATSVTLFLVRSHAVSRQIRDSSCEWTRSHNTHCVLVVHVWQSQAQYQSLSHTVTSRCSSATAIGLTIELNKTLPSVRRSHASLLAPIESQACHPMVGFRYH
jgi:hypothetical protein